MSAPRYILRELFTGRLRGSFRTLSAAMAAGRGFSYCIASKAPA